MERMLSVSDLTMFINISRNATECLVSMRTLFLEIKRFRIFAIKDTAILCLFEFSKHNSNLIKYFCIF
jgi:hypothetical protein